MAFSKQIRTVWFLVAGIGIGFVFQILSGGITVGVIPRSTEGVPGIILMPFFHAGLGHVISNVIPLTVLGTLIALRKSRSGLFEITAFLLPASGAILFLIGQPAEHIGASALVFAYFAYLVSSWYYQGGIWNGLLACIAFFLYWTFIPSIVFDALASSHVSWDGHLSGLASGLLLGYLERDITRKAIPQNE